MGTGMISALGRRRQRRWRGQQPPPPTPPPPPQPPYSPNVCFIFILIFYLICCRGASSRARHTALRPVCPVSTPPLSWHPAERENADARCGGQRSRVGRRLFIEPPGLRECTERSAEAVDRNDGQATGVTVTQRPPRKTAQGRITTARRPVTRARTKPSIFFFSLSLSLIAGRGWVTPATRGVSPPLPPPCAFLPRNTGATFRILPTGTPSLVVLSQQGPVGRIK